jgi:hypothetical protein
MRNKFEFIGIPVPLQRTLTKEWAKRVAKPKVEELRKIISHLWGLPEREYQRVALDLLILWRKQLTIDDVHWIFIHFVS